MLKILEKNKIIPVITVDADMNPVKLAEKLKEKGYGCLEITLRTEEGVPAIKAISDNCPNIVVGAGTVLTVEQVDKAVESGAKFIVSPGSNDDVIDYCIKKGISIIPGIMTPSEIEKNLSKGIELMKFFPAKPAGGADMLKAFASPYSQVKFMPTGGIDEDSVEEYLACKNVVACGGSWMMKK
jgi:2-dehydro-3-deoxyphosphogluconate aldolase/(4S)-4-hydroxy-2-oxoglutarate aldolase